MKGSEGRRGCGGIRGRSSRSCGRGGSVWDGGRGWVGSGPWLSGGSKKGRGISCSVLVSWCLVGFVLLKLAFMEDF